MTLRIFVIACLLHCTAHAQMLVNKNIEVGMMVQIKKCKPASKNFEYIDIYTKTRFPASGIKVDSITGDGIFESFFAPGDFDAKRLPCNMGNRKYRIAAFRTFDVEGSEKRVMILYTGNKMTMLWVELDKALEAKEIEF